MVIFITPLFAQMNGGFSGSGGRRGNWNSDRVNSSLNPTTPSIQPDKSFNEIASNIAKIESELKLSPEQYPLWQNFLSKIQSYYEYKKQPYNTYTNVSSAGLRYIQTQVDQVSKRYTSMEDIESAAKFFYEVLSIDQRKIFDQQIMSIIPL